MIMEIANIIALKLKAQFTDCITKGHNEEGEKKEATFIKELTVKQPIKKEKTLLLDIIWIKVTE